MGRPSLAPGIYFRLLMIGFFEGIDSERGIAWRLSDSISLREFCGLDWHEKAANQSTLSGTRRRISLEAHQDVFNWIATILARDGLVKGKTLGVDGTTLEANAALRSIERRDTNESYDEFLTRLAKASGIETPTREDLVKVDKKRSKKGSNDDWFHPLDPDAKITKMKDGRTHLAYKAEHAVDMETGALVALTVHGGTAGDTTTLGATEEAAKDALLDVLEDPEAAAKLSDYAVSEIVADKGYHSNAVLVSHQEEGIRTYISEPKRGRRRWRGKAAEKHATYGNRRRIRGNRGKAHLRRRGEVLERSFAHCYETGGMRRLHLRGIGNALKRLLIQGAGFNLGILMRKLYSVGKPRALQGLFSLLFVISAFLHRLFKLSVGTQKHQAVGRAYLAV